MSVYGEVYGGVYGEVYTPSVSPPVPCTSNSSWIADCNILAADLNAAFGQGVLYNDSTLAQAVCIVCPVTRERRERRSSPNIGIVWVRVRKVFVDDSEQAIRTDGVFTVDGLEYAIESIENKDAGGRTIVNIQRIAVEELTRPNYRG